MRIAARSDAGMMRKSNQDSIYYNDHGVGMLANLMMVADGMGGHKAGEKASELAIRGMVEQAMSMNRMPEDMAIWLSNGAEIVNRLVYEAAMSCPEWSGMGTTLVAAVCDANTLFCINVGDSRLYVVETLEDGTSCLRRVTVDHSVVEEMVASGIISREDAWQHPQKNLITRAVGLEQAVKVDRFRVPLQNIQKIMLCSDGLTDMLQEREILQVLLEDTDADSQAERLKRLANEHGGRDNISVIIADLRGE